MSRSPRIAALAALVIGIGAAGTESIAVGAHARAGGTRHSARIAVHRYSVQIQAVFTAAGNPLLAANFSPNGSAATPRWSICSPPPRSVCAPAHPPRRALSPGPRPPGTVFRAAARYLGRTYSARVQWHGRVTAHSRPRLLGPPRVGAQVKPVAATWSGGWGTEFDQLAVEACRTKAARHCMTVSGGQLGCPDHSHAVVRSAINGWYLFALDARSPADEACAGVAWGSESVIPAWPTSHTVARSAPYGPVTG